MNRRTTILALAAALVAALTAAAAPDGALAASRYGFRAAVRFVSPVASRRQLAQRRRYERRRNYKRRRFTPRRFSPRGYRYNRRPATRGRLPMSVVASRALACHPGRILDARLQGSTYVFKILTRRGRLVRVYGDARTGSVSCR
jgi:hypothetical protein